MSEKNSEETLGDIIARIGKKIGKQETKRQLETVTLIDPATAKFAINWIHDHEILAINGKALDANRQADTETAGEWREEEKILLKLAEQIQGEQWQRIDLKDIESRVVIARHEFEISSPREKRSARARLEAWLSIQALIEQEQRKGKTC